MSYETITLLWRGGRDGLRRSIGNAVYVNSVPWVRIPSSPPRRNKRNLFRFFILKNQPSASLFLIFTSVPSAQKRHLNRTALQKKTDFNKEICLF